MMKRHVVSLGIAFCFAALAAQAQTFSGSVTLSGASGFSWTSPASGCLVSGAVLTCTNASTGTSLAVLSATISSGVTEQLVYAVSGAPAVPAWVQGAAAGDSTGATHSTFVDTIPATTGSGPFHVCGMVTWGGTNTGALTALKDNNNVSYTVGTKVVDSANNQVMALFYGANLAAAPTSITETFNAAQNYTGIGANIYTGVAAASPLDGAAQQLQASPGTGAGAVASGAITTTQPDLVCGATIATGNFPSSVSAGSGWTSRVGVGTWFLLEDQVQTAGGSIAAKFTIGSNQPMATGVMGFLP